MLDTANTGERRRLVAQLASRGIPTSKIAARLGVPVNVIRTDRVYLSTIPTSDKPVASGGPIVQEKAPKYQRMNREERLATNKYKKLPEVTAKRRAAVIEMCREGKTDTMIAKALGVTATTVARDRKRLGIAPIDFSEPTVARRKKVKKMMEQGIRLAQISRTLGVATTTIQKDAEALRGKPVPQSVRAAQNREYVRKRLADNVTSAQIARELNVSQGSVWRYKQIIAEEDAAS